MGLMLKFFDNPYHRCGALIARAAVCLATLVWSVIILVKENALAVTSYGEVLTTIAPEDVIAGVYLVLSLCMLYRLIFKVRPNPWGIIPYTAMMALWGFIDTLLWLTHPLQVTAVSWVSVGFLLSAFALVSNPKRNPQNDTAGGIPQH